MTEPDNTPDLPDETASVVIRRHLDPNHQTIFARGDFEGLHRAWIEHREMWEGAPDGLVEIMMRQGLAAGVLHLSCRPRDEIVAWTLNIKQPPLNTFVTGDSAAATITGRAFTEDVQTADMSRLFVESRRLGRERTRSVIDVEGLDVLDIFEQYYERSEQSFGRFFELSDSEYLMVFGLPDSDGQWIASLDRDTAKEKSEGELKLLDERRFWFHCGCQPERILPVMREMYAERADELFEGEPRIEVSCPRCGRRWWLTRERFDADDADNGSNQETDE